MVDPTPVGSVSFEANAALILALINLVILYVNNRQIRKVRSNGENPGNGQKTQSIVDTALQGCKQLCSEKRQEDRRQTDIEFAQLHRKVDSVVLELRQEQTEAEMGQNQKFDALAGRVSSLEKRKR